MERKIGEIFEVNDKWYLCVEATENDNCNACDLQGLCIRMQGKQHVGNCMNWRTDNKRVIFKKLEKVGEPYESDGHIFQSYRTFEVPIFTENYATVGELGNNSKISIEIKQNKEDMEEKKHCDGCKYSDEEMKIIEKAEKDVRKAMGGAFGLSKDIPYLHSFVSSVLELGWLDKYKEHSNSEKIEKNWKPFDLEASKAGKPVCTRDGRRARIICFDRKFYYDGYNYPIVAMVNDNDNELVHAYTQDGLLVRNAESDLDLMMLPEKRSGWAKVRKILTFMIQKKKLIEK